MRKKKVANDPMPQLKVVSTGSRRKVSDSVLARSRTKKETENAFVIPQFPKAALPPGKSATKHPLAMDTQIIEVNAWAAQSMYAGAFNNGATFLGYPYLAQLAQVPEYRKIVETTAMHMTRKFISLQSVGDGDETKDKSDKIRIINDDLENFKVRDVFRRAAEVDGYFGRAHLYIDLGEPADPKELKYTIGNGRDAISRLKIEKGSLKGFKIIEPVWTYPSNYNSNNPLTSDWYNPQSWFVLGRELHSTRCIRMVGHEVPDLLKPAYAFGGLSMTQMAKPYVDNWLRTRQSVADTIWAFSTSGVSTDLATMIQGQGEELFARAELFNNLRNNRGLMILNKDSEEFFQVNTPLGTLDKLQAQAQEHMASVSSIPLVFLLGITPSGLNASSEGEIRVFYDFIEATQNKFFKEPLTRVIDFIQLNRFGEIDPEITFKFEPLWSMTDKELAEVDKLEAETDDLRINGGVISPLEARIRLAHSPETPYAELDVTVIPIAPGSGGDEPIDPETGEPEPPAPIGGASLDPGKRDSVATDEAWQESKHPRGQPGNAGQFGSGGGSSGGSSAPKHVTSLLNKPAGISGKYRQGIQNLLKDPGIDASTKTHLKFKLIESYAAKSEQLKKKGDHAKSDAVALKAAKLAKALGAQKVPINTKPASPEQKNDGPKHTVDNSHKYPDKFIIKTPEGEVVKNPGSSISMKFDTKAEAEAKAAQFDTETGKAQKFEKKEADVKQKAVETKAEKVAKELPQYLSSFSSMSEDDKASLIDLASFTNAGSAAGFLKDIKSQIPFKDAPNLTAAKAAHIRAYTGSAYVITNAQLRANELDENTYAHVKQLNTALDALPKFDSSTTRGTQLDASELKKWQPGKIVADHGFMSTTKKLSPDFGGNVQLTVHGKTGRDISKLSGHPSEQEVLFPAGTRFKVVDRSEKHGKSYITLQEV